MNPHFRQIKEDNLARNRKEREEGALILSTLPPVLFLELTQNCNLSCKMCRSAAGYSKELNMSDSTFSLIKEQLLSHALIVDMRGWGESTMLRNLASRVEDVVEFGAKIRLVTNALAISQNLWETLLFNGASVVVSVDAANANTMNLLGRGRFDLLNASLRRGSGVRDVSDAGGEISFNTVVSSLNLDEIPEIVAIGASFGIPRITLFPVVAKRHNPLHLDHRKNDIPRVIESARRIARQSGVELRLGASLHEEYVDENGLPETCSHPWEYCYIDFEGRVGYCDHLIGNSNLMLGSLHEASFLELWNGTAFRELRSRHVSARKNFPGILHETEPHCAWCYKRRYVDFEDATDPSSCCRIISSSKTLSLTPKTLGVPQQSDFM